MEIEPTLGLVDDFVLLHDKFLGQYIYESDDLHALTESFTQDMTENRLFITGFPFDEGTYRNGGRIGAENGPKSFRDLLKTEKLYLDSDFDKRLKIYDVGNIPKQKFPDEDDEDQEHMRARQLTLDEAHLSQRQRVGSILDANLHFKKNKSVVFAIGGSNDQSYCNIQSLFDCFPDKKLGIINIDSGFGAKQLKGKDAHSGSHFRLMLENPNFSKNQSKFICFASKGSSCSQEEYDYIKSKGADVYWLEKDIRRLAVDTSTQNIEENRLKTEYTTQAGQLFYQVLSELEQNSDVVFISFDLEAVNAKYCPGVSTPSVTGGLSDLEVLEIMQAAAESQKLVMMDMSEYNPAVESQRSGRFVVNIFYHFAKHFSRNV